MVRLSWKFRRLRLGDTASAAKGGEGGAAGVSGMVGAVGRSGGAAACQGSEPSASGSLRVMVGNWSKLTRPASPSDSMTVTWEQSANESLG
jgi:hypothetical protein